jgi:hypothetical protein
MVAKIEILESRQLLSAGAVFVPDSTSAASGITPTILSHAAASVIAGQKLNATEMITLTNTSGSTLNGSFGAALYLSSTTSLNSSSILLPESFGKTTTLKNGKAIKSTLKIASLSASVPTGKYYVVVQSTDPSDATATAASSSEISVSAPEVDLSGSFATAPTSVVVGNKAKVSLTLTEAGNIPVTSLGILFVISIDGQLSDGFQLANVTAKVKLQPNKPMVVPISIPIPEGSATGQQYLVAVLDPQDLLNNVNTSNNVFHTQNKITFTG